MFVLLLNLTGNLQDAWYDNEDAGWRGNARETNKQNLSSDGHECRRPTVTEGVHRWCDEWSNHRPAAAVWTRRCQSRLIDNTICRWIFFIFTLFACCYFFIDFALLYCIVLIVRIMHSCFDVWWWCMSAYMSVWKPVKFRSLSERACFIFLCLLHYQCLYVNDIIVVPSLPSTGIHIVVCVVISASASSVVTAVSNLIDNVLFSQRLSIVFRFLNVPRSVLM